MKIFAIALLCLVSLGITKEQEPNNRINQSQFIGELFRQGNRVRVLGKIRHPFDIDYYSCTVKEPTNLRISIITGAVSFSIFPGFPPLGGMTFAPWLRIYDSSGHILIDVFGFSGNIVIPQLHIDSPTTLYFHIISIGNALYPISGPDIYRLSVSDSL